MSGDVLENYVVAEKQKCLPDVLLVAGLMLSTTMLTIYGLVGGVVPMTIILCVLVVGTILGVVMRRYFPWTIVSCLRGVVSLTPLIKHPLPSLT